MDATAAAGGAPVTVSGRLDLRAAPTLRLLAGRALAAGGGRLVIDLSPVEFIDSAGIGVLVGLHRDALRQGGRLTIVAPTGPAREIFRATRTEAYFDLRDAPQPAPAP